MKQVLKIGDVVDDGKGDYLREGGEKIRDNFDDTYTELGDGNVLYPAGAWQDVSSVDANILDAKFGKAYALNTTSAAMTVKLPKGSPSQYNRAIKLRDVHGTWQKNNVTVVAAQGDTLKGTSDPKIFANNLADLELVYCSPGRWEYKANARIDRNTSDDISTVTKKEFICTEGQTDFLDVFGTTDFNTVNTQVYLRGNLLYYGTDFSDNSDYGSIDSAGLIGPLDGRSIRLRRPAEAGDSLVVITYLDGIAQWRSTYNRLDTKIIDERFSNEESVPGSTFVGDLSTLTTLTVEDLGFTLTSNSGLINPNTFEVYVNGVILNEAGTAGMPMFTCDGATADSQVDCESLGGLWMMSHEDYSYELTDSGSVSSVTFGHPFEHGDVVTLKWFNNDIGTTMELEEILEATDSRYISQGASVHISGGIRITDFDTLGPKGIEPLPPRDITIQTVSDVFDLMYPVGTNYENYVNPNNPATYFGFGVWKLYGTKRVLIGWTDDSQDTQFGLNNNDIDSNGNPTKTAGGTGGNRTIELTNDNLPATKTDEKVLIADPNGSIVIGGCQFDPEDTGPAYDKYREEQAKTNASHVPPKSIDTLSPYLTIYRWIRIQ